MSRQLPLCLFLVLLAVVTAAPQSRKRITSKVQQDIIRQMVSDGQIQSTCVAEAGGASKVAIISTVDLNRDGAPEFEVYGQGCACNGMRRCDQWIYRRAAEGYELLLGPLQVDGFDVKRTRTNGYSDITIAFPMGNDFFVKNYKYDGDRYQVRGCEDCVYVGRRRGSSTHRCTPVECPPQP